MLWGRRVWVLDYGEGERPGCGIPLCPRKPAGGASYFPSKDFRPWQPTASRVGAPSHVGVGWKCLWGGLLLISTFFLQLEIKNHVFFSPINWDDLYHKRLTPPFNPNVVRGHRIPDSVYPGLVGVWRVSVPTLYRWENWLQVAPRFIQGHTVS